MLATPAGPSSANGSLILEESLVRTPYELLRRSHRSAQRQVEKDFMAVQTALSSILKSLDKKPGPEGDAKQGVVVKLDQAADRVKGLKRKLDDLQPSDRQPSALRSRLAYLDELQASGKASTSTAGVHEGFKPDVTENKMLDRYLVDHELRSGRMETAKALANEAGLESLVDIKLFAELIKVEMALVEKQSVAEALAWCGENRGTLKKTNNNLEFTLRLQEFIELCRKRDTTGAIAYARKNLAAWAPAHIQPVQQGMALLAFGERTGVSSYRKLYDRSRWDDVRKQFRETFLNLYGLPSQSLLSLSLCAGLSSLRLPACVPADPPLPATINGDAPRSPIVPLLPAAPPLHNLEDTLSLLGAGFEHLTAPVGGIATSPTEDLHAHPEAKVGNVDCPTCGEEMKTLAKEVPMSHHVNSTIVCRISGEVMDSSNEPMAFPNGYVYSSRALLDMAKNNFGVVTCPRTRTSCHVSKLRKVYIS